MKVIFATNLTKTLNGVLTKSQCRNRLLSFYYLEQERGAKVGESKGLKSIATTGTVERKKVNE